jgi:serine/threonine protein kinase
MGEVYKARDPRLGRDVAIKVLPAAFSADPDRLRRFEQEARAAAALSHTNILALFDIGTYATPLFTATPGGTRSFFDVSTGGQRFLVNALRGEGTTPLAPLTVVSNWQAGR